MCLEVDQPVDVVLFRESCLETATQNAVAKAARLAAGGGVKVGELLQVAESAGRGDYYGGPQYDASMVTSDGGVEVSADAPPPAPVVQTKAVDLSVSVTARFAMQR